MRFCMLSTFYPPHHFGGDATYVRALSQALVARGHEVEVIHCTDAYHAARGTPGPAQLTTDTANDGGVIVHHLASRFGFLSPLFTQQTGHPGFKYGALKKLLEQRFDVVNFHNISLVGGPAILQLSNAPVTLYTLHEHWLLCPTHIFWKNRTHACEQPQCLRCSLRSGIPPQLWRYTGLAKRALLAVDALLSPSNYTARKHQQAGFGNDIRVLPLFSNLDPGEPPEFSPPPRPRFVYVGRVTASKGVLPMLKVFSRLPDFDLQVVGDGELLTGLRQQYAHCANISFKGQLSQPELVQHYQQATALLLPSLAPETFGLTVVEAFACATPAIVHDAGGSRELIDATGAGFVYTGVEELAALLKQTAADNALRRELGAQARAGFNRYYTAHCHLQNYLHHVADIQQKKGIMVH